MKTTTSFLFLVLSVLYSSAQESQNDEKEVYTIVETMPLYPGGDKELLEFVSNNVEYPKKAKDAGITGVVYVSYIVNKKGKVKKVRVVRGADKLLNKAAVKCIKKIKGYKPGTQKGKPVNVQFTIPIRFNLT